MIKQILTPLCTTLLLACGSFTASAAFNQSPPATGASETNGAYRNLASEFGKSGIQNKLTTNYNRMVSGSTRIYYEFGNNQAYIWTPDSNDVRTEGQSWAMTIAVMMDDQTRFDKLWRFAKTHQRNPLNSGPNELRGTFKWQLRINGNSVNVIDRAPAPDGELYYAFALLNADARWGSDGTFNYKADGESVLNTLRTKLMNNKNIIFSPYWTGVTDPSYQIPAFYEYFAFRASSNKQYWRDAATTSRNFLKSHFNKIVDKLPTYLAYHNGWPATSTEKLDCNNDGVKENNPDRLLFCGQPNPGDMYEYDAWRVAMNIGLDAHLTGAEQWHKNTLNGILNFFDGERNNGNCTYLQRYQWGGPIGTDKCGTGQVAANAAGLLGATISKAKAGRFFNDFWNQSFPSGTYRYYNGSMYMLALLHATGEFKFHGMANSG